jgi:excisionase family DNA binding protein
MTEPTPTPTVPCLAMRPKQAAQALGLSPRKLWELTASKQIPCIRLGKAILYPTAALERWLEERADAQGVRT